MLPSRSGDNSQLTGWHCLRTSELQHEAEWKEMASARLTAAAGHLWTPWTQYPSAAAAAVHRCSYMFLQSRPAQQNPKRGVVSLQRKAHERKLNSHLLGLISKFQKKLLYTTTARNHKIHNVIKNHNILVKIYQKIWLKIEGNNVTITIAFLLEKEHMIIGKTRTKPKR